MSKAKLKTFQVQMTVYLDTFVDVKAESLEQAIAKAKELGVTDVVKFESSYNNGGVEVVGVYDESKLIQNVWSKS